MTEVIFCCKFLRCGGIKAVSYKFLYTVTTITPSYTVRYKYLRCDGNEPFVNILLIRFHPFYVHPDFLHRLLKSCCSQTQAGVSLLKLFHLHNIFLMINIKLIIRTYLITSMSIKIILYCIRPILSYLRHVHCNMENNYEKTGAYLLFYYA